MTCEVVRDLITMYVDRTASDETIEAVKNHLRTCRDCETYCKACKRLEEKNEGFLFGREKAKRLIREKTGDIADLDRQFASLSRKLKLRKIRQTVIAELVLMGMAAYVVVDIVNAAKNKNS